MSKIIDAIEAAANAVIAQKDYLNRLDAACGDGDHGINMARGFEAVMEELERLGDEESPSVVFDKVGETLRDTVGGAAGPLYATAFENAGHACKDDMKLTAANVYTVLHAAVEAIKRRGRSDKGAKTMLDVLIPIEECFDPAKAGDKTLFQCLADAATASREGVEYTKTIAATKGRASYVGERSIGHPDPGAVSSRIMLMAVYDFLQN